MGLEKDNGITDLMDIDAGEGSWIKLQIYDVSNGMAK